MTLACETPVTGPAEAIAGQLAGQIPELTTPRLRLRAPDIGDFPVFADIVTGPRGQFFEITSREAAWLDFAQMVAGWTLRGHGLWTVEPLAGGDILGFVVLGFDQDDAEPELGYIFTEDAEGRGLATEAALSARDFAFADLKWPTLVSYIAPGNERSVALAERLGAARDIAAERALDNACQVWRHPAQEVD